MDDFKFQPVNLRKFLDSIIDSVVMKSGKNEDEVKMALDTFFNCLNKELRHVGDEYHLPIKYGDLYVIRWLDSKLYITEKKNG